MAETSNFDLDLIHIVSERGEILEVDQPSTLDEIPVLCKYVILRVIESETEPEDLFQSTKQKLLGIIWPFPAYNEKHRSTLNHNQMAFWGIENARENTRRELLLAGNLNPKIAYLMSTKGMDIQSHFEIGSDTCRDSFGYDRQIDKRLNQEILDLLIDTYKDIFASIS